ncbi:MAG: helix-turn-helix domain-containing protein [Romboutsia sp.]
MIKAIKVKLYSSRYKEELMFRSVGIARFSYNSG